MLQNFLAYDRNQFIFFFFTIWQREALTQSAEFWMEDVLVQSTNDIISGRIQRRRLF